MNQAKIEENQKRTKKKKKKVKVGSNNVETRWKLSDLQLKFFHYLPNYLSPTLQA